eukprot:467381-Pyramimonas_sp.AAC.1
MPGPGLLSAPQRSWLAPAPCLAGRPSYDRGDATAQELVPPELHGVPFREVSLDLVVSRRGITCLEVYVGPGMGARSGLASSGTVADMGNSLVATWSLTYGGRMSVL